MPFTPGEAKEEQSKVRLTEQIPAQEKTLLEVRDKLSSGISVTITEKGFSDSTDTPTRALVDSDRNVVVNVNKDSVGLAKESTLSSIDSKITKCDTDNIAGSVSITNFPSEYPLPSSQVSDLKNVNATIVSDSVGLAKEHVSSTDYHSVRITDGTNFLDPRDRNWSLSSTTDSVSVSGSVSVTNFPTDYPDSTAHTKLDNIKTSIESDQPRHITNAYDSANDRFKVALPYDARDRNWTLDSTTDSVSVSGSISVSNFPSEYPLPSSQVSDLKVITNILGSNTFNTSSVSVGTSSTQIIGANSNRRAVHIYVEGDDVLIGPSGSENYKIEDGEWVVIPTTQAIYGKAINTNATVYVMEV